MRSSRGAATGLALYLTLAVSAAAQTVLADLDGTWRGVYTYATQNQPPVEFVMTMQVQGDTCRGRIEEANTFGHPSAPSLFANVECQLIVGKIPPRLVFRKVYDGTGGQFHAVDYDGEISVDRRGVTGTWRLGTQSGRFSLTR